MTGGVFMIDQNLFLTMAQGEIENTNLFPFPFWMHVTFAAIALVFFAFRFFFDKKPYQLIFAAAVPFSLTLWASESRTWFYIVGAIELVLILLALISTFIFKDKKPAETPAAEDKNDPEE